MKHKHEIVTRILSKDEYINEFHNLIKNIEDNDIQSSYTKEISPIIVDGPIFKIEVLAIYK